MLKINAAIVERANNPEGENNTIYCFIGDRAELWIHVLRSTFTKLGYKVEVFYTSSDSAEGWKMKFSW